MLKGMGFAEDAVVLALRQTNNDPDDACAWLMDSAGDVSGDLPGLDGGESSDDSLSRSMQAELDTHQKADCSPNRGNIGPPEWEFIYLYIYIYIYIYITQLC